MNQKTHSNPALALLTACVTGGMALAAPAWGQVFNEDLKLIASDGATNDLFGYSIAIDNGVVALGAYQDSDNGTFSGSAYTFDASTGAPIAKLLPTDGDWFDEFGFSIAIDNDIVAVGARADTIDGTISGSAYLFDASSGTQLFKLLPNDGEYSNQFGYSIAIDDGVVAVGARWDDDNGNRSGSVYLFDASTGAQIAKLLPSDGATDEWFGYSVAIDNGVVAVGANRAGGAFTGAAYLFDVSTGDQLFKLLASRGQGTAWFGESIAIDDGVVAVGSKHSANGETGVAHLFDASTGNQMSELTASDDTRLDFFGSTIAIDNGVVAVGAYRDDDNGTDSGSAYLFNASTGAQIAKLIPSDGATDDRFGISISIDNGVIAVGAGWDDDNGASSGSAYVFEVSAPCSADLNGDGVIDHQDFLAFLNAWRARDPLADWNKDTTINILDFLAYLNEWVAGCP